MLQPLLENAVYHGIEPSSAPGTVSINIFLSRGEVHAILTQSVPRRTAAATTRGNKMALANIRERLALHFDAEASLESRVAEDAYEVHIRMPYRTGSAGARRNRERTARPPRATARAIRDRAARAARRCAQPGGARA